MTKFAAYDNFTIAAVANTAEAALDEAKCFVGDYEFKTAAISDDLAAQIERDGWDGTRQSFEVVNGEIVDTTDL